MTSASWGIKVGGRSRAAETERGAATRHRRHEKSWPTCHHTGRSNVTRMSHNTRSNVTRLSTRPPRCNLAGGRHPHRRRGGGRVGRAHLRRREVQPSVTAAMSSPGRRVVRANITRVSARPPCSREAGDHDTPRHLCYFIGSRFLGKVCPRTYVQLIFLCVCTPIQIFWI